MNYLRFNRGRKVEKYFHPFSLCKPRKAYRKGEGCKPIKSLHLLGKVDKIKEIVKKVLTKEIILYIIFGLLTTIVNLASFYIMNSILEWEENISNFVAILLAVLVAYITNKDLVFHSQAKDAKEKIKEFLRFMLGRTFTMLVEFVGGLLLFNLPIPNIVTKMGLTIIVIILNFFISKFFAFKSEKQ